MDDSTSSDMQDVGFNLKEFSQKRQVRRGTKTLPTSMTNACGYDLPIELQYETLLNNGISILKKDMENLNNNRVKLPLEVKREGRKTTLNICTVAKTLNRNVEHLVKFITTELVTTGAVKQDGYLWIKGNYIKSEVQNVLRRYIEQYVVCKICDNVDDTDIIKEKKLYFLKCYKCGGSRCVGNTIEGLSCKKNVAPQLRGLL
ncbi:MAG: hypothetical protein ACRCZW_02555 [Lactobacillaceae bacterium]